jgi:hypothetical protein
MDDVLKIALQRMPVPIVGEEEAATTVAADDGEGSRITAH